MGTSCTVTIVIVNWNSGSLLRDCLESIAAFGGDHVDRVVVVDNGSTDESLALIDRPSLRGLEVIPNRENVGFARACNQGAQQARSRYILFLNPDTRLLASSLSAACEYLDSTGMSTVGILGVQLLDSSNHVSRSCSRHPTAIGIVARSFGADRVFSSQSHFLSNWSHSTTRFVDQVIGACYFVRTSVFEQLQGFDEQFFVYYEEVDFAVRALRRGWKTVYFASTAVFHLGGGTSRQAKPQRLFYSLRSKILYARKHFSPLGYWAATCATLCIEPVSRLLAATVRLDRAMASETRDAYRWLWRWFLNGCKQNGAISPPH